MQNNQNKRELVDEWVNRAKDIVALLVVLVAGAGAGGVSLYRKFASA